MKKVAKKSTGKYVTEKTFNAFEDRFDSSSRAIAQSFADNAEVTSRMLVELKNINAATTLILKEITAIHEDGKKFRENISSLNSDGLSCDRRINNLTIRVEKLESK